MSLFHKKDFTTTNWSVLEKICQIIIGLYIIPKIFNHLGAFNSGELEISKAIIGVTTPLFFLGLSAVTVRELVYQPKLKNKIIGTTLALRAVSFVILFILISAYVYFTNTTKITLIVIIIATSYLFKICTVFEYYFVAIKQYKYVFIAKVTSLLLLLILQYFGVKNQYDVFYFATLFVLEWCFQSLIYFIILKSLKRFSFKKIKFSLPLAKQLIKDAFPLLVSNLIIVFYISIDDFFINHFLGSTANGIFAIIEFMVIFIAWNIGAAFVYGLYPALAECYINNKPLYVKRFRRMCIILAVYGILIGLFFNVFSKSIIINYYNESYSEAIYPLQIFAWSPLFIFFGMLFEKHLLNQNKLKRNVYRFILGCISSAILCFILIPLYGLIGAALALTLSHIITNLIFIGFYSSYRKNVLILFHIKKINKH